MIGGYSETYFIKPEQVMERANLSTREVSVLSDILGIPYRSYSWWYNTDGVPKTITEISKAHGVTKERIKKLIEGTVERMQVAYREIERETNG